VSVTGRTQWQRFLEEVRRPAFWLFLAAVFPLAIALAYEQFGLLYSYLIAPSGWIVYTAFLVSLTILFFCGRTYLRHIRFVCHARQIGAPRVPGRYGLGFCAVAALMSLKGPVVAFSVRQVTGGLISNAEWKRAIDEVKRKELPPPFP
jgi:hypothetical protein